MAVKKEIPGLTWKCTCGKWNFTDAQFCWKCHEPKHPNKPKRNFKKEKEASVNS